MTHAELVARLTLAIDTNSTPPIDGNATAADEAKAAMLLERLVSLYGDGPSGPTYASTYDDRVARRAENIADAFAATERAAQALSTMIIDRGGTAPDPGDPITLASGYSAEVHIGCLARHARDLRIASEVIDAAIACGRGLRLLRAGSDAATGSTASQQQYVHDRLRDCKSCCRAVLRVLGCGCYAQRSWIIGYEPVQESVTLGWVSGGTFGGFRPSSSACFASSFWRNRLTSRAS